MSEGKKAILCVGYKSWLLPQNEAISIAKSLCEAVALESAFDSLSGYELCKPSNREMPQVKFLDFPAIAELELGSD
jgi:hypothetical protein